MDFELAPAASEPAVQVTRPRSSRAYFGLSRSILSPSGQRWASV